MYHPAKVQERIEPVDGDTVFLVETWDENTFTVDAADGVETSDVGEETVVLLDYKPDQEFDIPTPKQNISAVLSVEQGEKIWERYRDLFEESKAQQTAPMQAQGANTPFEGGYIG